MFILASGFNATGGIGILGYGVSGLNQGYAVITDFGLNDKIDLGGADATTGTTGGLLVSNNSGNTGFTLTLGGVKLAEGTYANGITSAAFLT